MTAVAVIGPTGESSSVGASVTEVVKKLLRTESGGFSAAAHAVFEWRFSRTTTTSSTECPLAVPTNGVDCDAWKRLTADTAAFFQTESTPIAVEGDEEADARSDEGLKSFSVNILKSLQDCVVLPRLVDNGNTQVHQPRNSRLWLCLAAVSPEPALRQFALREIYEEISSSSGAPAEILERAHRVVSTLLLLPATGALPLFSVGHLVVSVLLLLEHVLGRGSLGQTEVPVPSTPPLHSRDQLSSVGSIQILRAVLQNVASSSGLAHLSSTERGRWLGGEMERSLRMVRMFPGKTNTHEKLRGFLTRAVSMTLTAALGGADACCAASQIGKWSDADGGLWVCDMLLAAARAMSSGGSGSGFLSSAGGASSLAGDVAKFVLSAALRPFTPQVPPSGEPPDRRSCEFLSNVLNCLPSSLPALLAPTHSLIARTCGVLVTACNKAVTASGKTEHPEKPAASVADILRLMSACMALEVRVFFDASSKQSLPMQTVSLGWRAVGAWAKDLVRKADGAMCAGNLVLSLLMALFQPFELVGPRSCNSGESRCGEVVLTSLQLAEEHPRMLFAEVAMCLREVALQLDSGAKQIGVSIAALRSVGTSPFAGGGNLLDTLALLACVLDLGKDVNVSRMASGIRTAFRIPKPPPEAAPLRTLAARWTLQNAVAADTDYSHSSNLIIDCLAAVLAVPGGEALPCVGSSSSAALPFSEETMKIPGCSAPSCELCWRHCAEIVDSMNGARVLSSQRKVLLNAVIPHLPPLKLSPAAQGVGVEASVGSRAVDSARKLLTALCGKMLLFDSASFLRSVQFIARQLQDAPWAYNELKFTTELSESIKHTVLPSLPKSERKDFLCVPIAWLRGVINDASKRLQKTLEDQDLRFRQFELEEKQFFAAQEAADRLAAEEAKAGAELRVKEQQRRKAQKEAAAAAAPDNSIFRQVQHAAAAEVADSRKGSDADCIAVQPPAKKQRTEEELQQERRMKFLAEAEMRRRFVVVPEPTPLEQNNATVDQKEIDRMIRSNEARLRTSKVQQLCESISGMVRSVVVETIIPGAAGQLNSTLEAEAEQRSLANIIGLSQQALGIAPVGWAEDRLEEPLPADFDDKDVGSYAARFAPLLMLEIRAEIISCAQDAAARSGSLSGALRRSAPPPSGDVQSDKLRRMTLTDASTSAAVPCRTVGRPSSLQDTTHVQVQIETQSDDVDISATVSKDDVVLVMMFSQEKRDNACGDDQASDSWHVFVAIVDVIKNRSATLYVRNNRSLPFLPVLSSCGNNFTILRLTNLGTWYLLATSLVSASLCQPFWSILCRPQEAAASSALAVQKITIPNSIAQRTDCNDFQKQAIALATSPNIPLALVDGPPGTGKTHTIHSIVSELLSMSRRAGSPLRILVCAPANVAVDELLLRLHRFGIVGPDGRKVIPKMVRVGAIEGVDRDVRAKGLFLDDIVRDSAAARGGSALTAGGSASISSTARESIMLRSEVVFSTLGSIRHTRTIPFDVVIVDEAAQAIEPMVAAALTSKGCKKLVLVGDPNQLQAVLLSQIAERKLLGRSLMQRLLVHEYPSVRLCLQYRMSPSISCFPNEEFYGGSLRDAEETTETPRRSQSSLPIPLSLLREDISGAKAVLIIPRMTFIDVQHGKMERHGPSFKNKAEADVVVSRMRTLRLQLGLTVDEFCRRVGLLTFYSAQVWEIQSRLSVAERSLVQVSTVDGFQGKEKDIVIISCVRQGRGVHNTIGFLVERNRMNVALTRAKEFLLIVGHAETLSSGQSKGTAWERLVSFCKQTGLETKFSEGVSFEACVTDASRK
jgi:hypothetical protein